MVFKVTFIHLLLVKSNLNRLSISAHRDRRLLLSLSLSSSVIPVFCRRSIVTSSSIAAVVSPLIVDHQSPLTSDRRHHLLHRIDPRRLSLSVSMYIVCMYQSLKSSGKTYTTLDFFIIF